MPPEVVAPSLAMAAVDDFLQSPDWRPVATRRGWTINRHGPTTLIVTLKARPLNGVTEAFTLRLECEACPSLPPDVRFVNPETLEYTFGVDNRHVARVVSNACYTHLSYAYSPPYKYGPQLVCTSLARGYYVSNHAPTPDQKWDPVRHSIGSSVEIVCRTLRSPYYQGRHA
jgi:hypothetical protein